MANNWKEITIEELQAPKKGAIAMGPFGSRIKTENFVDSGVPIIKGAQLHGTFLNDVSFDYLTQEKADELSSSKAFRGDIVITHRGTIGQVSVIPFNSKFETYIVSQSQLKVSLNTDLVNPYFVAYFLNSHLGQHRLLANASQVGVPAIAKASTSIKQILVPVPELDVQNQIVENLLNVDNKIALNRQTNQTLEHMAQALFKSWFVDFDPVIDNALAAGNDIPEALLKRAEMRKQAQQLPNFKSVPDDIRELFPDEFEHSHEPSVGVEGWVPRGWTTGTLSSLARFTSDRIDGSGLTLENYISTDNMLANKGGVSKASKLPEVKTTPAFKPGDILISNIRPYFQKIWFATFSGGRSNDVLGFEAIDEQCSEYLLNLLYQNTFFDYMMTTSKGSKMPRGDKTAIMDWAVAIPPKVIQRFFSKYVENYYQVIPVRTKESEILSKLRDTLLPKLISGEIALQDIDIPHQESA